tara:strand:+ start:780 stop:998 length:219 start_codon:yes stop_codon:yes gene_type:complete
MRVKDLIKELQKCDPDLYVGCYMDDGEILQIEYVDNCVSDRIDLNVTYVKRDDGETNKKQNEEQEDDQVYWC